MALYDAKMAAKELQVDDSTIRRLAAKHQIGEKYGCGWLFNRRDLAKLKKYRQPRPGRPAPWMK